MTPNLLALLDDIIAVLDDVAALTKIATKKSAGMMSDELALNARQVSGVEAARELPVVWAVAKGSLKNKAILVPAALALSAAAPWAVTPLLMCGGLYLCYEGFEALAHKLLPPTAEEKEDRAALLEAVSDPAVDLVAFEKKKIAGAIRTDFILSAEVIILTLSTAADKTFAVRAGTLAAVGLVMTVAIYGLVAAIVKLDDLGLHLIEKKRFAALGRFILSAAPVLMKCLAVLGTAAMFLVGGGILTHGIPAAAAAIDSLGRGDGPAAALAPAILNALAGVAAGAAAWAVARSSAALRRKFRR